MVPFFRVPALALILSACVAAPVVRAATAFGTAASNNNLIRFDTAMPSTTVSSTPITGLEPGETILGLDFRPVNGALYGLGSTSRLYLIDVRTAAAKEVGSGFTLSGTSFGFDFNPMADRIRVVSNLDQNFRLTPDTGTITGTDTPLAYPMGDPNFGSNPSVTACAYNSNNPGATATTLFGIDSTKNVLVMLSSPNNGTLTTIGSLGVTTNAVHGFDIEGGTNNAFAVLTVGNVNQLYTINTTLGAATLVGAMGTPITSLAVVPPSFTAVLSGTTVTFNGTAAGRTIIFDASGGLLRHNRFSAGDSGFNSDFDFDASEPGDQTLSATSPAVTVVVNMGVRDDQVIIGSAVGPASTLAATFIVDGLGGADELIVEDSASSAAMNVNLTNEAVVGLGGAVIYRNIERLALNCGSGADFIAVQSTSAQTLINCGAGNDTVALFNGATLSGGYIDGGAGRNILDYSAYGAAANFDPAPTQSVFLATMSGQQEPTPLSNSPARGMGSFVLNAAQTALTFSVAYAGLTGGPITGAHFHNAAIGNAGVVVRTLSTAELNGSVSPAGTFSGSWLAGDSGGSLIAPIVSELLANRIDFDIHTNLFASGEIRGQLIAQGLFGTATGTAGVRSFVARPVLTWAAPANLAFGMPLSAAQLNASANTPGTFAYSPPAGTVLAASTQTLSVTFTPTDAAAFTTASASVPITVVNAAPVFVSAPVITPSPAAAGQQVTFFAVAADNDPIASYAWDFGDGSSASGALVTHTYAAAGTFTVTVTATDTPGLTAASVMSLTVMAPPIPPGTATDADGDGFSDNLENAAGTVPTDATSTPSGGAPAPAPLPLPDVKLAIKLNFAKPSGDAIALSGTLLLSEGFVVTNKVLLVEVGNVARAFQLDAKGAAKGAGAAVSLKSKGTAARTAKFAVKLAKGNFGAGLSGAGLVNATVSADINVPVTVFIDGKLYQKLQAQTYKAKQEKSGASKDKRA